MPRYAPNKTENRQAHEQVVLLYIYNVQHNHIQKQKPPMSISKQKNENRYPIQ